MKLKNKFIAAISATVLALSMMVGTAFAGPIEPKFPYEIKDGYAGELWVALAGGGPNLAGGADIVANAKAITYVFEGDATFSMTVAYNAETHSWADVKTFTDEVVKPGEYKRLTVEFDGSTAGNWCEQIITSLTKTGSLTLAAIEYNDASGKVLTTYGTLKAAEAKVETPAATDDAADVVEEDVVVVEDGEDVADEDVADEDVADTAAEATATTTALPKTGVVSTTVIFGLGAAAFGAGATLLKKKED